TKLTVELGGYGIDKPLLLWINDGLMALFFLLVGLEIKRELITGELKDRRAAALPILAAVGGMVVPALIFALVNWGQETIHGWAVPMATDIAFALGVMALLGKRVPLGLKVFLTALAIVDDLGAVLVIALFYSGKIHVGSLLIALGILGVAYLYGRYLGRSLWVFIVIGAVLWYFMHESGIHATVAGVLLAFTVPMRRAMRPREVKARIAKMFEDGEFEHEEVELDELEKLIDKAQSPLHELEHTLEPFVAFFIMPVFAFFNAGFTLSPEASLWLPISLGAFLGLVVGKLVGVVGACWVGIRAGWATLPRGVGWPAIAGTGLLAGIGFTMSLFIATLAFGEGGALDQAKLGVLSASVVAAVAGLVILSRSLPAAEKQGR
ncbi:MAG: Na+/H+ antiporter NhaA, partial [Acidobacteria bacterium]|nr:Na+/H+ antiporter NhaA [Acidobacteriota bacterium]